MKEKMIKTAKGLDVYVKIFQIISAAGAAICYVIAVCVGLISKNSNGVLKTDAISVGDINIRLKESVTIPGFSDGTRLIIMTFFCGCLFVFLFFTLRIVRGIIAPMKNGRPFDNGTADKIRNLAFIVLGYGIFSVAAKFILAVITVNPVTQFAMENLINTDIVESITVDNSADLNFVITFFVLMLVSYIFRYGEELQTESDETL